MSRSRFSRTQDTRHALEVAFPGSSIWTYRILSALISASDAAIWLSKTYLIVAVCTLAFVAKLVMIVVGTAFRGRRTRSGW